MTERIVRLDLRCRPEGAISGAMLLQTEYSTFLALNAMKPVGDSGIVDAGHAVIEFERCFIGKFGYPNDEARWKIPRIRDLTYSLP